MTPTSDHGLGYSHALVYLFILTMTPTSDHGIGYNHALVYLFNFFFLKKKKTQHSHTFKLRLKLFMDNINIEKCHSMSKRIFNSGLDTLLTPSGTFKL